LKYGELNAPHFHKPILYLSYMKLRPYQAPRKQPKINDMIYPPGSRQGGGNVWIGGIMMNVPQTSSGPAVSPTPTPTITATNTPTPSVTATITPSVTPTNTVTPTKTGTPTPTPTPSSSPIPSGTTEANTYLTSVVVAGGTLDSTISAATRTLFTSLVSNGLYDKLYAFYPHIGGVSASHAINAKTPGSNNITFNGGWSFGNTTGSDPNGTNGYGQLGGVRSSVYGTQDSSSMGFYSLTNNFTTDRKDMGSYTSSNGVENLFIVWNSGVQSPYFKVNASTPTIGANLVSDTTGMFITSRSEATKQFIYRNGSFLLSGTSNSTGTNNIDLFISNQNEDGIPSVQYSTRAHGFTFAGEGFSPSEVSTLSTIINNFQTSLSRNTY
jgi:hypothetical protein